MKNAKLRVCASCEWIFKIEDGKVLVEEDEVVEKMEAGDVACPKCGFAHYGARFVYGRKAYKFAETQQLWLEKKLFAYESKLLKEIEESKQSIKVDAGREEVKEYIKYSGE